MVGLNLTHCRDVALRDLMVILHIVLQSLIIIILHFFTRNASNLRELVGLVVSCLGHGDLILRVQCQFRM